MGTFKVTMKTHSRKCITEQFRDTLNYCVFHGRRPQIFEMVVGRRKETMYVAECKHESCNKIAWTKEELVAAWNKYNEASAGIGPKPLAQSLSSK